MVPMGNCVLKIVECGRYGGEAMLPKAVLKCVDVIHARRKGLANIDGGGVVFDKWKDVTDTMWNMLEGFRSDYGSSLEGSVEPQMKGIVSHTGEQDEVATNDGKVSPWTAEALWHRIVLSPYPFNDCRCECFCT